MAASFEGNSNEHEHEHEEVISSEVDLDPDPQVYWWRDKYRPRKPKYNHPPKTVLGHIIKIFYPHLILLAKFPTYTIGDDVGFESHGNVETCCIIRFRAGPPYEDIAFRILDNKRDLFRVHF